ncbi:MAG: NAD-dependent epimerase/dehydratase family protein [Pseudomonadales bacterium]
MQERIVITGGAGLVGQNLVVILKQSGYSNIQVIDKHAKNIAILRDLYPDIETLQADLAQPGFSHEWLVQADIVITLHAQIGGLDAEEFYKNNVVATRNVLASLAANPDCMVIHVSSSVINSVANDLYVQSKTEQESLIAESSHNHCILRPTLMFGWFDRKHLGWLSRFMQKTPIFPIPGDGKFLRQPLFVADFCHIIKSCVEEPQHGREFNITGKERVFYIDLIRMIKRATASRSVILKIPFWLFRILLQIYAIFDRDPPFTTSQLDALSADDIFEVIDWENIFNVTQTPLSEALTITFTDSTYSNVALEF